MRSNNYNASVARKLVDRAFILASLPNTRHGIERIAHISLGTIKTLITTMRSENVLHIGDWVTPESGGQPAAVFVAGPGKDVLYVWKAKSADNVYGKRRIRKTRYAVSAAKPGTWMSALGI